MISLPLSVIDFNTLSCRMFSITYCLISMVTHTLLKSLLLLDIDVVHTFPKYLRYSHLYLKLSNFFTLSVMSVFHVHLFREERRNRYWGYEMDVRTRGGTEDPCITSWVSSLGSDSHGVSVSCSKWKNVRRGMDYDPVHCLPCLLIILLWFKSVIRTWEW